MLAVTSVAQAAPAKSAAKPVAVSKAKAGPPTPPPVDHMPIKPGMRFSEIRAATPGVSWTMTPVERYANHGFARLLSARGAAVLDGVALDVIAARGPVFSMASQHFVSAPIAENYGACKARIERFSGAVAKLAGKEPNGWAGEVPRGYFREPWAFNLADKLVVGESLNDAVFARVAELDPSFVRNYVSEKGQKKHPKAQALIQREMFPKNRYAQVWSGVMEQGDVRWIFVSSFQPDVEAGRPPSLPAIEDKPAETPPETPGKCRLSFSTQQGDVDRVTSGTSPLIVPRYDYFTRDQLRDGGNLAARYYALQLRKEEGLTSDEADTYLCSVALLNNRLTGCAKETPTSPTPPAPKGQPVGYPRWSAGLFLTGFAVPTPPAGEDDFTPRNARVQFAYRPEDKLPAFEWGKVDPEKRKGFALSRAFNINANDYPPAAIRHELQADVMVDCVVLTDLSLYCGQVKATSTSGKMPEGSAQKPEAIFEREVSRAIARRFSGVFAIALAGEDKDPRGAYLRIPIKFRLPGN
jgi:hypothetical protein